MEKFKKFLSVKLWRVLLVVMASLLAVMAVVNTAASIKKSALLTFLGGETSKVVGGDNADDVNTDYFKRSNTKDTLKQYMIDMCRKVEEEGIVLLRNNKLADGNKSLPVEKNSKVSIFGQGSVNFNYNSTGSSATASNTSANLKDALSDLDVNPTLWNFYLNGAASKYSRSYNIQSGYKTNEAPWSVYDNAVKQSFASYGDAAIFVISRDSGEGRDITTTGSDGIDGSYISISAQEQEVLKELTKLKNGGTFKRIIVLLNSPCQVQIDFMFDNTIDIDAALWVGNVGTSGIYAINDILVGKVSPSGRLSDTYAKDNFSSPAMAAWALNPNKSFSQQYTNAASYSQFDKTTQTVYGVYVEGIYVGYRYYETRYADVVMQSENVGEYDYDKDVAYPFGYGLSYSEFLYDDFKLTEDGDKFIVSVNVLNAGGYDAKEVVQVYMQKPYTDYDKATGVEKSAVELVGFKKVSLKSGQDKTVKIEIDKSVMRSYDANGKKTYILENGDYYFTVASDAHDAVNNILVAEGYDVAGKSAVDVNAMTDKYIVDSITASDGVDANTYANSEINKDVKIENQFDFADMNRYEGKGGNSVTYVSRNNWQGTFPKEAIKFAITDKMAEDIKSHKPLVEDGSKMPEYDKNNGLTIAALRGLPYNDPKWDDLLDQMSYGEQAYLITNGQHTTVDVISVVKPATTDENGPNSVSGSTIGVSFPSEGIWASTFNLELIYEVGEALGEDAVAAGVTGLYAPGVNLHRTPFGGRAHEYFSEDPFLMGMCSVVEIQGMQSRGVWAYVKHYAANDEETNRAGVAIWMNEQEMREIVLYPFELSCKPNMGNAHAMMTSFNRIGNIWTSASSALMEKVLRDEWGFDGFAVTDMASSNAQTFMTFDDGIANGTDCFDGAGSESALDAYRNSAMFANKMREAAHRILYVTANYSAALNGISPADRIVKVLTWWQALIVAVIVILSLFTAACAAMLGLSYYYRYKKSKSATEAIPAETPDEES